MLMNGKWFEDLNADFCKIAPDLDTALMIEKIAAGSPADILGLRPGDSLLSLNGQPAALVDIEAENLRDELSNYCFYMPREQTVLHLKSCALPLGLRTLMPASLLVQKYQDQGYYGNDGLLALWEREDYVNLRQAAKAANRTPLAVKAARKMLGGSTSPTAVDLFLCICEIEAGKPQLGTAMIELIAGEHMKEFTSDLRALIHYYMGLRAQDDGDYARFEDRLRLAYDNMPGSDRIKTLAASAGLQTFAQSAMLSAIMPTHYEFEFLRGGKGWTDLQTILDQMSEDQILPICFMPGQRANRAYNDAVKTYRVIYPHMVARLHPLVVITDCREDSEETSAWTTHEQLAGKTGLPLLVLHERTGRFVGDLQIKDAPVFWALDKAGRVIWDAGLADTYDYWEMHSQAGPAKPPKAQTQMFTPLAFQRTA